MDIPESVVAAAEYVASWASENNRGDSWEIGRCASRHELIRLRAETEWMRGALEFIRDHGMTSTKELLVREAGIALAPKPEHCVWVLPREAGIFYSACGEEGMGFPPDEGDTCRGCGNVVTIRIAGDEE